MENRFEIDINRIKVKFACGEEKGLTHKANIDYNLFPFVANEKNIFTEFDGVTGAFSRLICDKEIKGKFDEYSFIENVSDCIEEYDGSNSELVFKDIVRTMFLDKGKLVEFDIKALNYREAQNSEEKFAKFLYSLFYEEELKSIVKKHYEREVDNILYKVVLKGLPELSEKKAEKEGYIPYVPFIKELFIEDFKFLIKNEEFYKKSIKRFLEYYYMFYISQTLMKLNYFEKADLTKPEVLYYTLSWEKTSKHRTAYQFGLEKLKRSIDTAFSHAITLELISTSNIGRQMNYVELGQEFKNYGEIEISQEINKVIELYKKQLDFDFSELNYTKIDTEVPGFEKIYELYKHIEYQFLKASGTRKRANEAYRNWYLKFLQNKFGKNRGRLGYSLNFTEEDIILMTKICIKDLEKLKLSMLFKEFEKRGLFFDRDSQTKITQLYEKLNLLEKKSDSGDAQYVKSVL
ncbi:DNA phosphorothioation-dependent restriction protein DptG [Clostridium thermobutyricum]|uniref:DNA phosphorothioation-dependent restriction protein DptG n=1 Tax=Clostridium thermobutyricum TaxID=29372 RepID=UPI003F51BAE4